MRLDKNTERGLKAWLRGSDKYLYAAGASFDQARRQLQTETTIAVSPGVFRRVAMYCRTAGRVRWWRGYRRPLPTTEQAGDAAMSLLFEAADLSHRPPNMDLKREDAAFVARLLGESGFRCSPGEAAQVVAALNDRGE